MRLNIEIIRPISIAIVKELIFSVFIIFILSIFTFALLYIAPGESMLDDYIINLQPDSRALISTINSSDPISIYLTWLTTALQGNMGVSSSSGLDVFEQITFFAKNTLLLTTSSLLITFIVSIPLVILIIRNQYAFFHQSIYFIIRLLSVMPLFWLAYVTIFLSIQLFDYYPLSVSEDDIPYYQYLLPVLLLSLGSGVIVEVVIQLSYEIKRVLKEEYILCARAKGASVFKHLFKEAIAFPLLNLLSNRIAYLIGATIIVEQIFNWPGIGRLIWQATQDRDMSLLLGAVIIIAVIIRTSHFLTRLVYILINPRASHE